MGIFSTIIPIFTLACGNISVLIITFLILVFSALLFMQHSKYKVQAVEHEVQQNHQDHNVIQIKQGSLDVGSTDSCSESEIIDQFSCTTEEDSDFDGWQFSGESCRRPDCSDGSISDEESLIEIELPGGHYVGYKDYRDEEKSKYCYRKRSPESVLWWPEMNEEENMIEIDISVGSIKCSRFEIKA